MSSTTTQSSQSAANPFEVRWVQNLDELRQAQRLRYQVFSQDLGAMLPTVIAGHDIDTYDDVCDHLLVLHRETGEAIGTYRLMPPAATAKMGGSYCESEFDLSPLAIWRPKTVELGRSCVHPDYRSGGVMLLLWGALAKYMFDKQLEALLGCVSIPLSYPLPTTAHSEPGVTPPGLTAATLHYLLPAQYRTDPSLFVQPLHPLNVAALAHLVPNALPANWLQDLPALFKGYVRIGTKILSAPALDEVFQCADFLMMLKFNDLPKRYLQHFLSH